MVLSIDIVHHGRRLEVRDVRDTKIVSVLCGPKEVRRIGLARVRSQWCVVGKDVLAEYGLRRRQIDHFRDEIACLSRDRVRPVYRSPLLDSERANLVHKPIEGIQRAVNGDHVTHDCVRNDNLNDVEPIHRLHHVRIKTSIEELKHVLDPWVIDAA